MNVYSKFNKDRKLKYQLVTKIGENNNQFFSSKEANTSKAISFLNSLFDKFYFLKKTKFSFDPVKPKKDKYKIFFPYQNLSTIEFLLYEQFSKKNRPGFIKIIKDYIDEIQKNDIRRGCLSEEFKKIFKFESVSKKEKFECLETGCVDLNFNNIFFDIKKRKFILIDYEWVFKFPIPYKYVIFRAITSFYFKYFDYNIHSFINLETLFDIAHISPEEEKIFINFEYNFQLFVCGKKFERIITKDGFYQNYLKIKKDNSFISQFEILVNKKNNISSQDCQNPDYLKIQKELESIKSSKFFRFYTFLNRLKKIKTYLSIKINSLKNDI